MKKTENIINRTGINKTECKKTGHSKENKIPGVKCTPKIELYLSNFKGALHWWNGSLFFLIIILGITLGIFAGCKNIFVPEPPATPEAAGPGGGITVSLRLFTGSARSVMPGMKDLTWEITASQGDITISVAEGAYPEFSLSLPVSGTWTFTVRGINSVNDEIFTGSAEQNIESGSTVSISIPLSPGSGMGGEGATGKLNLTIKFENVFSTSLMSRIDNGKWYNALWNPTVEDGKTVYKPYSITADNLSVGPHTLDLYFGGGSKFYFCTVAVNIWPGMTSDQWIKTNGEEYINDSGEFVITDDMVDKFVKTMGSVVYVDANVKDDEPGTGSIYAPVNSVSTAVDILRKANSGGKCNGTIMVFGETTIDREIEVKNGEKLTVKGTGENAFIKNNDGRVFKITGGSLTLGENITLTGTVTDGNGGAVYVNGGTFTMEADSKIIGSRATGTTANGGAVYVNGGTFTMEAGSKITGSSANGSMAYGGAVFIYDGTFNMNGGFIGGSDAEKNTAVNGGGVFVQAGTFNMNGTATIQGNEATGGSSHACGGGVYVNGGTFTMNDTAIIQDNEATGTHGHAGGGGVYVINGTFTMRDNAIIQKNNASTTDTNSAAGGGGVYVINGGKFTMTDNAIIQNNEVTAVQNDACGGGVYVIDSGTFIMNGTAIIKGNEAESGDGGGVYINNGTFTMDGGVIGGLDSEKNTAPAGSGGGVYVAGGTFTMNDGTIGGIGEVGTDVFNNAYVAGGGVYVGDGTFTMNGGIITGNTTDGNGAGVYLDGANAKVTLNNTSSISGNLVNNEGGGVYVGKGIFTLSGTPNISGNLCFTDANNVYLVSGKTITIGDGGLTENARIGVITAVKPDVMSGVKVTNTAVTNGNKIFTSDEGYYVDNKEDGVYLRNMEAIYKVSSGSETEGTFAEALAAVYSSADGGTITLLMDINGTNAVFGPGYDTPIIFTGGTEASPIILDLNGKTIDRGLNTPTTDGSVIKIEGGTLTIKDSSATNPDGTDGTGTITGGNSSDAGGGIRMEKNSFLTLKSGNIIGNSAGSIGGGVFVTDECTFIMEGGKIASNRTDSSGGGGVGTSGESTFTINGGIITNNTAKRGGGVEIGTFTKFTMTSGIITGNTANENGGGVNLSKSGATMTLGGGTISSNTAGMNGGGVNVNLDDSGGTPCNFTMTGGTISGNTASANGGGVYVGSSGGFTLGSLSAESSPVISGNTKTGNSPNNVYLDDTKVITIAGTLNKTQDSGNIGITMAVPGVFTSDWSSSGLTDSTFFFSDDENYKIELDSSNECKLVTNDLQVEYKVSENTYRGTFADAVDAVNVSGGTITLLKDIDDSNAVFGTGNTTPITFTGGTKASPIILDLNGFTINRGLDAAQDNGSVIKMNGGVLTIKDSSVSSTGIITGGNSTTFGGGIFIENNGSLTLENGSITGNKTSGDGGGVYFSSNGTFTMSGGSIKSNVASNGANNGNGGGVCLNGGTFTMSGTATIALNKAEGGISRGGGIYLDGGTLTMTGNAAITDNQAPTTTAYGGGIYLNSGTFNMKDGEITDNKAGRGGGVYFPYKADGELIFNLGDSDNPVTGTDPVIRNNTNYSDMVNNVYVESGALIEIVGNLSQNVETEENIGITKKNNMGNFAKKNGHTVSVNEIFSSDQSGYIVDMYDEKFNISPI